MAMMRHIAFLVLCINVLEKGVTTSAYPIAAGSCNSGGGVGFPHASEGGGSLSDGSFSVSIDDDELAVDETLTITTYSDHTLTITADDDEFKGFLFRLSSSDGEVDLSDSIFLKGDQSDLAQTFPNSLNVDCPSGVGGACHTSLGTMPSVSVTLSIEEDATDLSLEVTVVTSNNLIQGFDGWYYSSYSISTETVPTVSPAPTPSVPSSCDCEESKLLSLLQLIIEIIE